MQWVKTDSPNFYKPSTHNAMVKTGSLSLNKPPTGFPVVKTDTPKFYNDNTCFAEATTDSLYFTSLIHPLRWSNGLYELLQG